MSIQTKVEGAWRTITQPWVKTSETTYTPAIKVFTKVAGVWREAWPLKPNAPGAPVVTTTYRNDRIEMDVSWAASVGGEPVAKYIITVAGGGYSTTVVVNAPSTSMTLTNNGEGFHMYAGWGMQATVYAQSTAGRNSDSVTGPPTTVSQLPPPPQPTSYSVSVWQCAMHHDWSHVGGRRITGVDIHVYHNGVGGAASYNAWTYAADYQSWNPAAIGGGSVSTHIRTTGPGGVSPWVTITGELPNPIGTSSYRFGDGYMRANSWGVSPAVQVFTLPYGGGYSHVATFGAGAGEIYDPQSVNYARDRRWWGMLLRPINQTNGWTGRDQWMGWIMKIPNPHYISPIDSDTWGGSAWRLSNTQDWQGSSLQYNNTAYFFYGNQFYDYLSNAAVGYDIGITGALLALRREVSGRVGAVSPQLMVHRAGSIWEDTNIGGSVTTNALERNQTAWVLFPADWAWLLKERWDGWKGIGLHHPNTQLLQGLNYVSSEYSIFTAWNAGTIDGGQFWLDTVCIFHSG